MSFSRVCYFFGIVLLLNLCGCGSSSGDIISTTDGLRSPSAPSLSRLDGMVFLGQAVPGATVRAQDKTGRSLATTTTDSGGFFHLDGLDDSMQLTLSATLPESDFELLTLVDPTDGEDFPVIGIPSTLITRYIQSHPGKTWPAAEDWFSRLVGASTEQNWGSFLDESEEMPFSHLGFFVYAARQGGIDSAVSSLLTREPLTQIADEVGPDPLFDLEYEDLNASFDGLDLAYLGIASTIQETTKKSYSFGSAAGSVLRYIGEGVAGNVLSSSIDSVWTWITSSLGLNSGPDLKDVQVAIDSLTLKLGELSHKIDTTHYEQTVANLNSKAITPILVLNRQISALAMTTRLTDEPFFPSIQLNNVLASLAGFELEKSLKLIQNHMLGTNGQPNLLALTLTRKMESLGVDQQPHFMNMPLRSNAILNDVLRTYNLYEGYQILVCDLLAELSHVDIGSLVAEANGAADEIARAAISLKLQRSQLPRLLPSDRVLADLENGLMWYLPVVPARDTLASAREFAGNFRLEGTSGVLYDDWRVPNMNELRSLRVRGRYANPGATSWGQAVAGLGRLGFEGLENVNVDGEVWCRETESVAVRGTISNPNPPRRVLMYAYKLNGDDRKILEDWRNRALPLIMVRSIGTNLHPPHFRESPATPPASPLRAGEAASLGTPVAISSLETAAGRVRAQITYAANVGGGFHCGRVGELARFDLPALRQDIAVSGSNSSHLAYESGLQNLVKVLNLPGREGEILWKEVAQEVGLKASILGFRDGGFFPVNVSLEASSGHDIVKPRTLVGLRILPRNRLYISPEDSERYVAVGSYSDGTLGDLTGEVVWSLVSEDGLGTPISGARFASSPQGLLELEDPSPSRLRVVARLGSMRDETKLQIAR